MDLGPACLTLRKEDAQGERLLDTNARTGRSFNLAYAITSHHAQNLE